MLKFTARLTTLSWWLAMFLAAMVVGKHHPQAFEVSESAIITGTTSVIADPDLAIPAAGADGSASASRCTQQLRIPPSAAVPRRSQRRRCAYAICRASASRHRSASASSHAQRLRLPPPVAVCCASARHRPQRLHPSPSAAIRSASGPRRPPPSTHLPPAPVRRRPQGICLQPSAPPPPPAVAAPPPPAVRSAAAILAHRHDFLFPDPLQDGVRSASLLPQQLTMLRIRAAGSALAACVIAAGSFKTKEGAKSEAVGSLLMASAVLLPPPVFAPPTESPVRLTHSPADLTTPSMLVHGGAPPPESPRVSVLGNLGAQDGHPRCGGRQRAAAPPPKRGSCLATNDPSGLLCLATVDLNEWQLVGPVGPADILISFGVGPKKKWWCRACSGSGTDISSGDGHTLQLLVLLSSTATRQLLLWHYFDKFASTRVSDMSIKYLRQRLQNYFSVVGIYPSWLFRPSLNRRCARSIHPGARVSDAPAYTPTGGFVFRYAIVHAAIFFLRLQDLVITRFSSEDLL